MIPSYKQYPATTLAKPKLDSFLQVPNKYYQMNDFTKNPSKWIPIEVGDARIPLFKINNTIDISLFVTEETDYKYFTLFLAVDKDFANPTYIATTHTKPKVKITEGTSFFMIDVYSVNHRGEDNHDQQFILFKTALEIIFLKPVSLIGGSA